MLVVPVAVSSVVLTQSPLSASCTSTTSSSTTCSHTITDTNDTVVSESQCTSNIIPAEIPADIAAGPHQPPVQPVVNFPSRTFGSKKRSFNCEWYKLYSWLEYSKVKDAYCYPCHFFTISGSGRSDVAFTHNGFHDWKHVWHAKHHKIMVPTSTSGSRNITPSLT